jgi:hypothetical protein
MADIVATIKNMKKAGKGKVQISKHLVQHHKISQFKAFTIINKLIK